jgi:hypothetical protein
MNGSPRTYARLFRQAGILIGKGSIARALEVLKAGQQEAERAGDRAMAGRFQAEIRRLSGLG